MRFIHDRLVGMWLFTALITLVACWFLAPNPQPIKAAVPAPDSWKLPTLAENESRKSTDAIVARNLWGMANPTGAPAAPEPTWSIQGIVHRGSEHFVLMSYEGKPAEVLKVGDSLPDGAKIVQIDKERFVVQTKSKKKLAFGIYKYEQQN